MFEVLLGGYFYARCASMKDAERKAKQVASYNGTATIYKANRLVLTYAVLRNGDMLRCPATR